MYKTKKQFGIIVFSTLALAGCKDPVRLPKDYKDPLFTGVPSGESVAQNDKQDYYNAVLSSDAVYQKTVKDILKKIASVGHNYTKESKGSDVSKVIYDIDDKSVADGYHNVATFDNLQDRARLSMLSGASTTAYTKDNLFYEQKYVDSLVKAGSVSSSFGTDVTLNNGKLLSARNQELDQYDQVFKADYSAYQKKNLYADNEQNYLTAEYIYTKSNPSIGNTNARKVQVISLADRSDEIGDAKRLLDAYVNDFILKNYAAKGYSADALKQDSFYQDKDFYLLEKLWKGITKDIAGFISADRYDGFVVLSDTEEAWLRENKLISGAVVKDLEGKVTGVGSLKTHNLIGKILDDIRKIEQGKDNYALYDSALESSYTGSYAYSTEVGYRKAVDEIAQKSLITKGIHLKGETMSSVPDTLKDRIFDSKITSSKKAVENMKKAENLGRAVEDLTAYEKDGFRYLTKASTLSGSSNDADRIIHYDTASKTYYLVRILDVIDTNGLNANNTDSIYHSEDGKMLEQISREVAYTMSTTGSYKTDATIYWLSRTEIKYSDSKFLEYMKTNYNDLFKKDNPWKNEVKIILPEGKADEGF